MTTPAMDGNTQHWRTDFADVPANFGTDHVHPRPVTVMPPPSGALGVPLPVDAGFTAK